MTLQEMNAVIDRVMASISNEVSQSGDIPQDTGRLRSAIKVRPAEYGFDVYVDDGGYSEEEWSKVQSSAP